MILFQKKYRSEWLFQILITVVLFFLYSFDKHSRNFEWVKVIFFLSYTIYALLISYIFIPSFLLKKKYLAFFASVAILFTGAYFMEELVLEKIFYKGERGQHVSNFFFTLLEIFPLVITMVSFKLIWDMKKKQVEVEQLKTNVKESELRFLKAQINPHFLFNNLNNLYSYAVEESKKTPSIILELSSVLRYMLYDCKENYVSLTAEVEHLTHYIALSELQIEERGNVQFQSDIKSDAYAIAPLILTMFVENAFKHSTSSQSKEININIAITISEKGALRFSCKNSYLPKSNLENLNEGIGLKNVKKRLSLLYPNKHILTIEDENNTYTVTLEIQLNTTKA